MENNMERENQIIRLEITNDVNDSKRFDKKASKTILKMSKKKIVEWYDALPQKTRMELQKEFGKDGVPDRETKFYQWLVKRKQNKKS